ncbi:hypothetical protein PHYC_02921 [Phycisphaerales bacterium]|nr:hypothetical protein PHYC_02921 [Phycisphaerales bacterium]
MIRVYLCRGDEAGWAIDEDRRMTHRALEGVVDFVEEPSAADVIHACWWEPLMRLPRATIDGKPVLCHMAGDPARVLGEPRFLAAVHRVTHWIAQSRRALDRIATLGRPVSYVPYALDPGEFAAEPLPGVRDSLPPGSYVIANFHRDSAAPSKGAAGETLWNPKLVKGPDVFVEVLAELRRRGRPVVALLAGPRRHWVRDRLSQHGVPYVFVGSDTPSDDYPANILPRATLARLYAAADLCLITSRSEGGPRAVLEASAAGIATLSTPVGIAPDVLAGECLFTDPVEAVEKIEADLDHRSLRRFAPAHRSIVAARHTPEANRSIWRTVYKSLHPPAAKPVRPVPPIRSRRVAFWNKFTPPPWGGGNQFMMALMSEARRQGIDCTPNGEGPPCGGHIVNSVQFDIEKFESTVEPGSVRVVHRIDGPISMLRGTPESLDQDRRCFEFNARYATATVIQSWHTMSRLAALGFRPVNPVLILNACDPAIFKRSERLNGPGERLRVIATSWSPNPGKGAAIYQWLDANLDFSRYELTFVGNCPVPLRNIRVLPPHPSEQLAALLQQHDVYLTASRNDPCSNALIEALACGLPAVYLDSGGHPELAQFGGLPFTRPDELPVIFERLRDNYNLYRNLIAVESIGGVCRRYLSLLFDDALYQS